MPALLFIAARLAGGVAEPPGSVVDIVSVATGVAATTGVGVATDEHGSRTVGTAEGMVVDGRAKEAGGTGKAISAADAAALACMWEMSSRKLSDRLAVTSTSSS